MKPQYFSRMQYLKRLFFLTRIKAWETEPFLRHSNQGHFPRDLKCGQENSHMCRHPGQDGHMGKLTSDAKGMRPIDPQTSPASPPRTVPWASFIRPGSRLNSSEFVSLFLCFSRSLINYFTRIQILCPAGQWRGK